MKRLLYLFVLVALLLAACREQTKEEIFLQGMEFVDNGNHQAAVTLFKRSLEKDPNYIDARLQLGIAYLETGKYDKAENELEKALRQQPDNPSAILKLSEIYLGTKRPEKAVSQLEKILESDPDNADALFTLAKCYIVSRDRSSAEKFLRQSLVVRPDYSPVELELARLLFTEGRNGEAEQFVAGVLKREPENTNAYQLLMYRALSIKDVSGAIRSLEKIKDINAGDIFAVYMLGLLYIDAGRIDDARQIASELTTSKPNHPAGFRVDGLVLYQTNDYEKAIQSLQKSNNGMPDLAGFYFLGLSYYRLGQLEQALGSFQKALDESPNHEQSRLMVAQTLLKQGRVEDCIRATNLVLERNPLNANAHNILASAYMAQGNYDLAMAEIETAIKIDPDLTQAHLRKGLFNLATGNNLQGEVDLANAISAAPDLLNTRLLLATHYIRQHNYPMAFQVLDKALAISPDSALIYNLMAAAYFGQNNPEAAVKSLIKAKTLKREFLTPYFNLANYHISQKDYEAALLEYQAVLEVNPDSLQALLRSASLSEFIGLNDQAEQFYIRAAKTQNSDGSLALAFFQLRNGQNEIALQTLRNSSLAFPDNPKVLTAYAERLRAVGQLDEAIAIYIQLEDVRPGMGKPLLLATHLQKGDFSAANEIADLAITENPSSSQGYLFRSAIHQYRSEWQLAEKVLHQGIAATDGNLTLKNTLARLYSMRGKKHEALEIYGAILSEKPDLVPVLFYMAAIYDGMGDKKQAQNLYEKILNIDENHAPTLNNLAYLLSDVYADNKRALKLASKGFRIKPNDPRIMDTLGYVLLKNDQIESSISFLEKASSLMPTETSVQLHLAQAYKAAGRYDEAVASLANIRKSDARESELKAAEELMKEMN